MADPRFFERAGPFTLEELAQVAEADLLQKDRSQDLISDVAALDKAGADSISFLDNQKYKSQFEETKADAVIVKESLKDLAPKGTALLLTNDPYRAYALVAQTFYPKLAENIHQPLQASIDETAKIGKNCSIGSGVFIGPGVTIGDETEIGPNTVIARGVSIGNNCLISSNVTIGYALIGNRVHVYPGVRIGQEGFGFAMSARGHERVPQLGRVVIEDDVSIGANSCIDRGAGPDTVIGAGSKLDNLVQIAHNVQLGRGCVLAAQVGISGSTKLGDFVVMGGQAGAAGHLSIGMGVQAGGKSGIIGDIAPGQVVAGYPAQNKRDWLKGLAIVGRAVKKGRKAIEDK